MFCCTLLNVHSSVAIILMGKRELIALLNLSSWCLVMVERLFHAVPRGCLQFVIVVFPDHTHLLFWHCLETKTLEQTKWHHINGKCLTIIQNPHKDIKSKIIAKWRLFCILPLFKWRRTRRKSVPYIIFHILKRPKPFSKDTLGKRNHNKWKFTWNISLSIILLPLYADDTVFYSSTETNLQHTLDSFNHYCKTWHLTVNVQKNKNAHVQY